MTPEPIEVGKFCVYIGPEPGRMLRHRVVAADTGEVVTWSQFKIDELGTDGFSWLGDRETFCKHFRPVLPCEL